MSATPLSEEAAWAERFFRFLRHSRACRTRHHPGTLTWMEAEEALAAHAATMHQLAAKLQAAPVITAASLDVPRVA